MNSLIRNATPFALLSMFATVYELTHALRLSKSTHMVVHAELLPKALAAAKEVGLPEDRIYILDGKVEGKPNLEDMRQAIQKRNVPQLPVKPATCNTLAYLVFSSGTSGLPKGERYDRRTQCESHLCSSCHDFPRQHLVHGPRSGHSSRGRGGSYSGNYQASYYFLQPSLLAQIPPPETPPAVLLFLPFYHTFGLHMSCFRQFYTPITYVIIPRWNTDLVLRLIPKYAPSSLLSIECELNSRHRYNINIMPLIPSAIHQMVNHKLFTKTDFSSLRGVSSGAAYLPPDLSKKFLKLVTNAPVILEGQSLSVLNHYRCF